MSDSGSESTGRRFLRIYLNDHLAGAAGGIALARRALKSNPDPPFGPFLRALIEELEVDQRLLESVMAAHGLPRSRVKQAAALVAERLGRAKLNGALRGYSPLSRLVELEGLRVAIGAKLALWQTLTARPELAPRPEAVEAARLRAESQLEGLEPMRLRAAETALVAIPEQGNEP